MAVLLFVRFATVEVDLTPESIVLVFASKFDTFKPLKDNMHTFSGLCKHWFYRDANSDMAFVLEKLMLVSTNKQFFYYFSIVWKFTNALFDRVLNLIAKLEKLIFSEGFLLVYHSWFVGRSVSERPCQSCDHCLLCCSSLQRFLEESHDIFGFII